MSNDVIDQVEFWGEDPGDMTKLHPVLQQHLVEMPFLGLMVKHPLVNQNAFGWKFLNDMYEQKLEHFERKLDEDNYSAALWLVERPWRMLTIAEWFYDARIDVAELRDLLAQAWIDTEFIGENQDIYIGLFKETGFITDAEEREDYDYTVVYRGTGEDYGLGMSWTFELERAEWFARRFGDNCVYEAIVARDDVLAEFFGRGESEVVVDPETLQQVKLLRRLD